MTVSPRLVGRLGNILFEISCAIGYARKYGIDYEIPTRSENGFPTYSFPLLKYISPHGLRRERIIREKQHNYYELPAPNDKHILLSGYWQSIKYFEHCIDEVRHLLQFDNPTIPYIGLHIRRGDYLNYPTKHPVCPIEYYMEALRHKDLIGKDLMVFSDDIPWCKSIFGDTPIYPNGDELDDIYLFASCQYQIIANSSFSLFAAMMGKADVVISPSKDNWFGPGNKHLDTSTLIPDKFIQIKY